MYNKIYNNPDERSRLTYPYCYRDDIFTEQELDNMCQYFSQHEIEKATVMSEETPIDENIRRSKVKFFNRDDYTFPIFDRLNSAIEDTNDRFYNFILNGYDSFQYTEYHHEEKGAYNFHMDSGFGDRNGDSRFEMRKLSVVMCLNRPGEDFEGGQFYMNMGSEKNAFEVEMKRGRIILFPSFLIHRVAPVTKGIRKSLVIWVTGPKFR
jgi:PKHD-type hydroxylase